MLRAGLNGLCCAWRTLGSAEVAQPRHTEVGRPTRLGRGDLQVEIGRRQQLHLLVDELVVDALLVEDSPELEQSLLFP